MTGVIAHVFVHQAQGCASTVTHGCTITETYPNVTLQQDSRMYSAGTCGSAGQ